MNGIISIKQKATEDFIKTCPFCHQEELIIETAKLSISTYIDMSKPKTFGSQSELNTKNKEKESQKSKNKKPWYRKQDKVNFNILKNPHKYITTGQA